MSLIYRGMKPRSTPPRSPTVHRLPQVLGHCPRRVLRPLQLRQRPLWAGRARSDHASSRDHEGSGEGRPWPLPPHACAEDHQRRVRLVAHAVPVEPRRVPVYGGSGRRAWWSHVPCLLRALRCDAVCPAMQVAQERKLLSSQPSPAPFVRLARPHRYPLLMHLQRAGSKSKTGVPGLPQDLHLMYCVNVPTQLAQAGSCRCGCR